MMQIDFDDVHDVTGWSTEDVDLVLHKKLPGMKQFLRFIKTFDNTTLLYLYNLITISIKYSEKNPHILIKKIDADIK
jgi:hypothetical protein